MISRRTLLLVAAGLCTGGLPVATPAQQAVSGPRQVVALFAQFADEANPEPRAPAWAAAIFDPDRRGSLPHYYDRMSFGRLRLRGEAAPKRYTVAREAAYYAPGAGQEGCYNEFALDVLRQADADVDFSRFDADGDGAVDGLFIVLSSTPRDFINAGATGVGNLGADEAYVTDDVGADGRPVRIEPAHGTLQRGRTLEEAVGSMAHEYGHVLGLGDLYNVTFALQEGGTPADDDAGIGAWGLMGWGATGWPGGDGTPSALSAWSRARLGWGAVHTPGVGDTTLRLAPVATTGQMIMLPLSATESFLLEYRTRDGDYDRDLPAEGLLVWHVARGVRAGDGSVSRTLVDLECADGRWADAGFPQGTRAAPATGGDNLDYWAHDGAYRTAHAGNLGDATDPFDGVRFPAFTPETNPAAVSRDGSVELRLEEIRVADGAVTATLQLPPPLVEIRNLRTVDDNGDGLVFEGEEAAIGFGVRNRGGQVLADLTARVLSDDPRVTVVRPAAGFGELGLGQQALVPDGGFPVVRVDGSDAGIHRAAITLQLWSGETLLLERSVPLVVHAPRLVIDGATLSETAGNGDGAAQPGEVVAVGLDVSQPLVDLTETEAREWERALQSLRVSIFALDEGVRAVDGGRLVLTVDEDGPRTHRGAGFVVDADLQPSQLPDGEGLRFEVVGASEFSAWRDTVSVPFAGGPDRTPPLLAGPNVGRDGVLVTLWLPAARVQEGGEIAWVRARVYDYADTTLVTQVELHADGEGDFHGRLGAGNTGRSPLQVLTTIRAPVQAGNGQADGDWVRLPALPAQAPVEPLRLTAAPSDPRVLYLLTKRGLWRSDDGAATWQPLRHMGGASRYAGQGVCVDAHDPFRIYTEGARPLVSADGGVTWGRLPVPDPSFALQAASPSRSGRLLGTVSFYGEAQFAESEDGGASWFVSTETGVPTNLQENPADPSQLYGGFYQVWDPETRASVPAGGWHSVDGGRTWDHFPAPSLTAWAVDPLRAGRLYGLQADSVYVSDDHGRTWVSVARVQLGPGSAWLSVHPRAPQLVVNSTSRAWMSTDGIEWDSLKAQSYAEAIVPSAQDPSRFYAIVRGVDGDLHIGGSEDRGRTWMAHDLPRTAPAAGTVLFDAAGRLLAGSGVRGTGWQVRPALALRTADGSWDWRAGEISSLQGTEPQISGLLIDPFESDRMLVMVNGRILRTENAGSTWVEVPQNGYLIAPSLPLPVLAHPLRQGFYVRVSPFDLNVSHDGGIRWQQRLDYEDFTYPRPVALDPEDPNVIYAMLEGALWRSPDAGATWEADYAHLGTEVRILAVGPGPTRHMYAVSADGIHRSVDRGRTWARLADFGDLRLQPTRIRFDPGHPERFYLVGPGLALSGILETRDGGVTWTDMALGTSPRLRILDAAVDPQDGTLYAATPWGVYRHDGGRGTAVAGGPASLPVETRLGDNYPNPFNAATVIPFTIGAGGRVDLGIYDIVGQRVRTLLDEVRPAGTYAVTWDGHDAAGRPVASGVYFTTLRVAGTQSVRRLLLLK